VGGDARAAQDSRPRHPGVRDRRTGRGAVRRRCAAPAGCGGCKGDDRMTTTIAPKTAAAVAQRGEILPGFTLPDIDGSSVSLESYRGRTNLVVVFAGDKMDESPVAVLLEELVARREEFTLEAAQVLVAVTSRPAAVPQRGRWAFPVLVDDGADIHRNVGATDAAGRPAPAVFVTDRFREIY